MSTITNVILTCAKSDAELVAHRIDFDPSPYRTQTLRVLSDHNVGAFWGGTAQPTCTVLAAAFLESVIGQQVRDHLVKVKWSEPAAVRLLIQEQGDAAFSVYVLGECDDPYVWHLVRLT